MVGAEDEAAVLTLRAAVNALALLAAGDVAGGRAARLVVAVQEQVGRLTAITARLVPVVECEVAWADAGARSVTSWLASAARTSYPRARALVEMGRAMRDDLPLTAAAALAGDVPIERLETLARLAPTTPQRRAALAASVDDCGEEFLLAQAQVLPAEAFRLLARRWAAAADPEADERGYREACDREFVELSSTTGGVHLAGFLTTEHGASLRTALDAVMGAPIPGDERTTSQRRAQALADLSRVVLDNGLVGTGAAVRPHLSCVVDLDTLRRATEGAHGSVAAPTRGLPGGRPGGVWSTGVRASMRPGGVPPGDANPGDADPSGAGPSEMELSGPPGRDVGRFAVAELLGAGPFPRSVLSRLACDSQVTRVVFGPDSQVLDVGRAERTFTGAKRRAVIARDRTCRFPGCGAPASLSEVHHIEHWARGGGTDVNAGILLCWFHHDYVHRHGIEIERQPGGGRRFTHANAPLARA